MCTLSHAPAPRRCTAETCADLAAPSTHLGIGVCLCLCVGIRLGLGVCISLGLGLGLLLLLLCRGLRFLLLLCLGGLLAGLLLCLLLGLPSGKRKLDDTKDLKHHALLVTPLQPIVLLPHEG